MLKISDKKKKSLNNNDIINKVYVSLKSHINTKFLISFENPLTFFIKKDFHIKLNFKNYIYIKVIFYLETKKNSIVFLT